MVPHGDSYLVVAVVQELLGRGPFEFWDTTGSAGELTSGAAPHKRTHPASLVSLDVPSSRTAR